MAAFYGFALWQDRSLARQTGESGRAYEQQKQQFAKVSAELSRETRNAARSGPQEHRSGDRFAPVAAARARNRRFAWIAGYSEYLRALRGRPCRPWLTSIQMPEGGAQLTMSAGPCRRISSPSSWRLKQEPVLRGRRSRLWRLPGAPRERPGSRDRGIHRDSQGFPEPGNALAATGGRGPSHALAGAIAALRPIASTR